jgi:hypothetical protein
MWNLREISVQFLTSYIFQHHASNCESLLFHSLLLTSGWDGRDLVWVTKTISSLALHVLI